MATGCVYELGVADLLNSEFGTRTASNWYIGLVVATPTIAQTDTYSTLGTHITEVAYNSASGYTNATRIQWAPGAAVPGSTTTITNAATINFTMGASFVTATIWGIVITNFPTTSGGVGNPLLAACWIFGGSGPVSVAANDTLAVTVQFTGQSTSTT